MLKEFNVTREGLSQAQVKENFEKYGENALKEEERPGVLKVFFGQFKDLLVIILLVAAIISMISGQVESTIVIFAVLILNAVLGTVQHFKAQASLDSLKKLSSPIAKVMRGGEKMEVPSEEVVPGDIIMLEAGDMVVADGRIIDNYSLQVNESSLTGESEAVQKDVEAIQEEEIALGDQKSMVFSGSLVTYGRANIVVTATGMETEIGKIATLMNLTQSKKTPLQVSMDNFSKKLAVIIIVICIIVFGLSIYREMPIIDSLMFAVALAVAAIPEALSSIVTIVMAMGTQKMAKENAIIKDLKAVESLGSVSIICSDKTGTLTMNKMTTRQVYVDGEIIDGEDLDLSKEPHADLIHSAVLASDATSQNGVELGDPTEVALINLGHKFDVDEIKHREKYTRLSELAFDSDRKMMSTLFFMDGKYVMVTKGAFDVLLEKMEKIQTSRGVRPITEEDREKINEANLELSAKGLRVLCFVYKILPEERELTLEDEKDFTFSGLISMVDPPRPESVQAVADARHAGIKPIMITGDHKITATAIAKEIGIIDEEDVAMDGIELDKLSDEELDERLPHVAVYARVSPEHKIRIVDAWQRRGNIVSMTGDGVNDAPALKKADVGVAMGITGTEVSKDAASMILTDDNFATIVKAVANGRNVYTNIKNAIGFLLSGNLSAVLCVLFTSVMALPIPFLPVHLLFINLLTDSLPAIAIGMEKAGDHLLDQKPRDPKEGILTKDFLIRIFAQGIIIGFFVMIAFYRGLDMGGAAMASTMAFVTLTMARLFHGFNCRTPKSIFRAGLFSNGYSIGAFFSGLILLSVVVFIPVMSDLFSVVSLTGAQMGTIALLAFAPTIIIQVYKMIREVISA